MEIRVKQGSITDERVDLIIVNLFRDVTEPGGATGSVDAALDGAVRDVIAAGDFTGKAGETLLLYTHDALPAPRVLIVGLGEPGKFGPAAARNAAATAVRKARDLGAQTIASVVHGAGAGGLAMEAAAQMLAEGTLLGTYRFQGYRSAVPHDWKPDPEIFMVVEASAQRLAACQAGVARGIAIATGVLLARDLVNEPANHMTPATVAGVATELADELGLKVEVLDQEQMAVLGMGILLAVAAASEQPPRFVILEHNAGREDLPVVVLVGKGVTFDSGGISIKPAEDMWRMKDDMAGGAAVLGAMTVAARLDLPLHVVGLVPLAENLPGGRAQKPGDVFTGMTGKTMEVISTDAEGRMLLADTVAYAGRFKPTAVVDIANSDGSSGRRPGTTGGCFLR